MKKQSGFTLVEIMIALVIGLIVVTAIINIYGTTAKNGSNMIKSSRLNHDLEAVMALMINDIKRSGYWSGATVSTDIRTNPFTATNTNIQIFDTDADVETTAADCILYTYDADGDGTVDSNEYYGFKLEKYTKGGVEYKRIKIRKSGTTTTVAGCGTTAQDWEEFIDGDQLTIADLQFSFTPITTVTPNLDATSRCLHIATGISTDTNTTACTGAANTDNLAEKRAVNIVLEGSLSSDANVIKRLNGTVEVRNNRIFCKVPPCT
jgi:prepilin peptidase dependent protein B